jgi:hypothetical protein
MKWLILLILFSCTTHKKVESPTESTAKPVSPYTVKPCYCEKIFMPVCGADGTNYGNSCEAECQGNKTWTEGSCKNSKKKK